MAAEFVEELELTAKDTASSVVKTVGDQLSQFSAKAAQGRDELGRFTGGAKDASGVIDDLKQKLASFLAVAGLVTGLTTFVSAGIEMNKTLEDTRTGIAAVIAANTVYTDSGGHVVSSQVALQEALKSSSEIQQKLKVDALSTAASYQELVQTFQTSVGPAMAAGVTDLDSVRKITVSASQTMQALGIDSRQASQEIRAMFTGEQGPDNRLNQVLGITKGEIEKVRKSGGDLAQFYMDKMAPFTAAAAEAAQNFSVRLSNLGDAFSQMAGEVTKPIFDALKNQIGGVMGLVDAFKETLSDMGRRAAEIIQDFAPLVQSVATLGLAVADAGLKFLGAMSPLVPVVVLLADGVAYMVDKVGPLGLAIYAAVQVFGGLTSAVATIVPLISSASTAFGTLNVVMAANPIGATVVALTALAGVAAIVAVKLREMYEASEGQKAMERAADGVEIYRQRVFKLTGDMISNVDAEKLLKLSLEDQHAAFGMMKTQLQSVEGPYKDVDRIIKDVTTHLKANAKETGISPQAEKALEATKKKYDELLTKAKEHLAFLESPVNMSVFEKIKEKYGHDIDAWTKKYGESSELVKTATKEMELELLRKAQTIADAYKAIPVAVDVSGAAAATSVQKFSTTTQEIVVGTSNVAREAWIGAFNAIVLTVPSVEKSLTDGFVSVWNSLSKGADDLFFSVLKGDFDSIGGILSGVADSILHTWTSMLVEMVQRWILGKEAIKGNPLDIDSKGLGGGGFGALGYLGAAGAGYGIGSGIGQGGVGNQVGGAIGAVGGYALATGALSGLASGLGLGASAGPIGAILGAIIGAIAGGLFNPSTEKYIDVNGKKLLTGDTMIGQGQETTRGTLLGMRDSFTGAFADLFEAAGTAGKSDLVKDVNASISEYLKNMHFQVNAGSDEDLQKDFQHLLTDVIPKEALHGLFGNQRLTGLDMAGISGASFFSDAFEPGAPIPKMLLGLGFSGDKIREISRQIDTQDPQRFIQYLGALTGVVTGFRDLTKNFAKSATEVFGDIDASRKKTAVASFTESATQIKDLAGELSLYSGDEQIRRAQQLIQLGNQRYEAELQYLSKIRDLQDGINASITGQVRDIRFGMLDGDTGAQKAFLNSEIAGLNQQLLTATAPEVIQQIVAQIQQKSSQLFGLYDSKFPEERKAAGEQIIAMLEWVNSIAQQKLKEAAEAVTATNAGLSEVLKNATRLFTELGGSLDTLPTVTTSAGAGLDDVDRSARRTGKSLAALADAIDAETKRRGGTPPTAEAAAPTSTGRDTSSSDSITPAFLRSNYGRFIPRTA